MYTISTEMPGMFGGSGLRRAPDTQLTDIVCDNVAAMVAATGRAPAE